MPAAALSAMHPIKQAAHGNGPYLLHPARLVAMGLASLIAVGTVLLMLPAATSTPGGAPLLTALFTSASASCVTGLVVVDTGTYWSGFGHVVILGLLQVGGLGVMASASLLAVLIAGRMGLRSRLVTEYETGLVGPNVIRRVLGGTIAVSVVVEVVLTLVLAGRLWLAEGYGAGRALWYGVFHAISAFNSGGFALWPDSLVSFTHDAWVTVPIMLAFVMGGLGFLVIDEVTRMRSVRRWSIHTKITLMVTAVLAVAGPALITLNEWSRPATLGGLDLWHRLLSGLFSGLTPRSAGFSTIDYSVADPTTLLLTDVLMFIGGGSGSTAGGIKVTTFAVLVMSVVAEARGSQDVDILGRRISPTTVRQAIAVVFVMLVLLVVSTMVLIRISGLPLDDVLFETTSALGTVGLSTGITERLPAAGQYLLVALMFAGRIGSVTLVATLALRVEHRLFRNPEGRPMIG
jgi:trk system potassium uptake protein TrkH